MKKNEFNKKSNIGMKQPESFGAGEFSLKNYQIFGVGWLVSLYKELGIGGILADEMVDFFT
jgi:SNF2 family DNA or RNA helicase